MQAFTRRQVSLAPVALALAIASTLMPTAAHAQSYAGKVVNLPSNALGCAGAYASLSPLGDVLTNCSFKQTNFLLALLAGTTKFPGLIESNKWVVLKSNGTILSLTGGAPEGFNAAGNVVGRGSSLSTDVVWKGTVKSTWSAPSSLSGKWRISYPLSAGGKAYLLYKDEGQASSATPSVVKLATLVGSTVKQLPTPPTECQSDRTQHRINDAGQVGLLAHWEEPTPVQGQFNHHYRTCLWTGTAWTVGPALPDLVETVYDGVNDYNASLRGISDAGALLMKVGPMMFPNSFKAYYWPGPGTDLQVVAEEVAHMGAGGELLGYGRTEQDPFAHAFIWRNGVAVDLNTITTGLPPGITISTALAINKNGQVLATFVPKDSNGGAYAGLLLLTPR